MKKFLLSTLAAFFVSTSYAEDVIGDPPIDEGEDEITLEAFLQKPLSQIAEISMEKYPRVGFPDNIYSELLKIAESYNNRGKGIFLSIQNALYSEPYNFCNKGYSYEPKNIHITCNDSFQTVINLLNDLKLQKKDWEPKYSFRQYKRMTLLDLAEKVEEGSKTKEFDLEDLQEDLTNLLTKEYGNLGYLIVNDGAGLLRAVGTCGLAKSSGAVHRKDVKKLCNLSIGEAIEGYLE